MGSKVNRQRAPAQLYRYLFRLRWLVPLFILAASGLHEMLLSILSPQVAERYPMWLPVVVYGATGSVVAWFGLGWLARLMREREEAEEELRAAYEHLSETHRRLLAIHDIGREIASAADMQQVLEVAARAPISLVNAKGTSVITFDPERNLLHLDVAWGLSDVYVRRLREQLESGVLADRCRSCDVLTAHVSGDCPLFEGMRDVAQREGIQSLVCLPFGRGERREGIITAYLDTPNAPPEDQVHLLGIVAAEIASVLESIRLRDQQVEALYAFEGMAHYRTDEEHLLAQVLEVTLQGWNLQRGAIFIPNRGEEDLCCVTRKAIGEVDGPLMALLRRVADRAYTTRAPYVVPDVHRSPLRSLAVPEDVGSVAAVPLFAGQEVLAILVIVSEMSGYFRQQHAPFFLAVGHHAGLAISNARLQAQVEQLAVLEERYRISREIHDGLAQSLSFIGWRLDRASSLIRQHQWNQAARELEEIRQALRDAYLDVRESIDGLRLNVDHPGGFLGALADYVANFRERTGLDVVLEEHTETGEIPDEIGVHLMRIVQEGLTNVRKHAQAKHVTVRLSEWPDRVELDIMDDGAGFDPDAPRPSSHVGLSSMRERVHTLGGTFTLVSRPGAGTRISVIVPKERNIPTVRKVAS